MIKFDKEQCRKSRFPFVVLCKVPDTLRSPNYFWFERGGEGFVRNLRMIGEAKLLKIVVMRR